MPQRLRQPRLPLSPRTGAANLRSREFDGAAKEIGLDGMGLTPHKLRHTAVSLAAAAQADVIDTGRKKAVARLARRREGARFFGFVRNECGTRPHRRPPHRMRKGRSPA